MKVSTKLGDTGTTSAHGQRIDKTSLLIECLGQLDSCIAECVLLGSRWCEITPYCKHIVEDLNCICAIISGYMTSDHFNVERVDWLESEMNENSLTEEFQFIYPFKNEKAAQINHLRTTVRSAERNLFCLSKEQDISQNILSYINRLSDFWFIMCCKELQG